MYSTASREYQILARPRFELRDRNTKSLSLTSRMGAERWLEVDEKLWISSSHAWLQVPPLPSAAQGAHRIPEIHPSLSWRPCGPSSSHPHLPRESLAMEPFDFHHLMTDTLSLLEGCEQPGRKPQIPTLPQIQMWLARYLLQKRVPGGAQRLSPAHRHAPAHQHRPVGVASCVTSVPSFHPGWPCWKSVLRHLDDITSDLSWIPLGPSAVLPNFPPVFSLFSFQLSHRELQNDRDICGWISGAQKSTTLNQCPSCHPTPHPPAFSRLIKKCLVCLVFRLFANLSSLYLLFKVVFSLLLLYLIFIGFLILSERSQNVLHSIDYAASFKRCFSLGTGLPWQIT